MKRAYLKAISYYLPEKILTNSMLSAEFPEWSAEKIASKIGIDERHVAAPDETAKDMGVRAGLQLFKEHNVKPSDIDFILFCTQSPDYLLPTSACLIQHELKIPTTAGAIDFNQGCSGFVYGLSLAKGLILGGIAQNILLITSETYTKHIHQTDKGNRTIFGDASAAVLVSNDGFAEIGEFSLGTDGAGANNLIIKSGGSRTPANIQVNIGRDDYGNFCSPDFLYMNGTEIFNFTLDKVPELVKDTLLRNKLKLSEVNLFVFHQANRYMLNFLRKKIKIEESLFYYYMSKTGNTVSSTIPIALHEALQTKKLSGNILLAGFGVGYSWAGVVLKAE